MLGSAESEVTFCRRCSLETIECSRPESGSLLLEGPQSEQKGPLNGS